MPLEDLGVHCAVSCAVTGESASGVDGYGNKPVILRLQESLFMTGHE